MKYYYISIHKLKIFILALVSIFLQSCGGLSNSPIFQIETEGLTNIHDGSTNPILIKHLVGRELVAQGGHLITFYQEEGQLKAEVRMNVSGNFSKFYKDFAVYLGPGINPAGLVRLNRKEQEKVVALKLPKIGRQGQVYIGRRGLLGGMMEGDENQEGKENDKKEDDNTFEKGANVLGTLEVLPIEIIQIILAYISFEEIVNVRLLNRYFYSLTTGYNQPGLIGVENKPANPDINIDPWAIKVDRDINFRRFDPNSIYSCPFYQLIRQIEDVPREFWSHLQGTKIRRISLINNGIENEKAAEFTCHLKDTRVLDIELGGNAIEQEGAIKIGYNLQATDVNEIGLAYNQIGEAGAIGLAQYLKGTKVKEIDLGGNNIGPNGAIGFVQNLKNTNVKVVYLEANNIGDSGAIEVIQNLVDTKVKKIYLDNNNITNRGAIEIARILSNTNVKRIGLTTNKIDNIGAIEFAKALHDKTTKVKVVDLSNNNIDRNTMQVLAEQYTDIKWEF